MVPQLFRGVGVAAVLFRRFWKSLSRPGLSCSEQLTSSRTPAEQNYSDLR